MPFKIYQKQDLLKFCKIIASVWLGILSMAFYLSCSKKDSQPPAGAPYPTPPYPPTVYAPTILSFEVQDYCNRKVIVTGLNFDLNIKNDSIFFGQFKGIIDSVTQNHIYATYPSDNIFGKIKVFCKLLSVVSAADFFIEPPRIKSISPTTGGPGATLTIEGENFNLTKQIDSVTINNLRASIVSSTLHSITISVPQNASSGTITVYCNCRSLTATTSFVFSNKGIVYVSGNAGYLHAIDISSGTVIWRKLTSSRYNSGPTYSKGIVYIGSSDVNALSNNYMYALNGQTGEEIWNHKVDGPWSCIPCINEDVLYAGSFDKKLYAFNATTGDKIWDFSTNEYFSHGTPTYYNGSVFVENDDGNLYSVNAATGAMNWKRRILAAGNSAVDNGILYTSGTDSFYALNAGTGNTIWSRQMQPGSCSPTLLNNVVYVGTSHHQVFALNASTGDVIWQQEATWWVDSAPYIYDNVLYVQAGDGGLMAMDLFTGERIWTRYLATSDLGGVSPVVANNILYIGDDESYLNAIDAKTGELIWRVNTGNYPILSNACVVDENGKVYFSGASGNHQ